MWLSQQMHGNARRETVAETGTVTLGGDTAGVYLSGERRGVPVYCPGGYQWRPMPGQQVLVMKAGADGESPAVTGVLQEEAPGPGEVRIFNGDESAELRLIPGGEAKLSGGGGGAQVQLSNSMALLTAGGAGVRLEGGTAALTGQVTVNGEGLEAMIARIARTVMIL